MSIFLVKLPLFLAVLPSPKNEFHFESVFLSQFVCKSNKVSLGITNTTSYIVLYGNRFYNTFHTNKTKIKDFLILQYNIESKVVQYSMAWVMWVTSKRMTREQKEVRDGRAVDNPATGDKGAQLQFHSCLTLMAQVLVPCSGVNSIYLLEKMIQ